MHEMGVVLSIVRELKKQAEMYNVKKIGSVTLEIGELTGVIPLYVHNCWPAAIENTVVEGAQLIIREKEGLVTCKKCQHTYRVMNHTTKDNRADCPHCHSDEYTIIQGRDLTIEEIGVYDE